MSAELNRRLVLEVRTDPATTIFTSLGNAECPTSSIPLFSQLMAPRYVLRPVATVFSSLPPFCVLLTEGQLSVIIVSRSIVLNHF